MSSFLYLAKAPAKLKFHLEGGRELETKIHHRSSVSDPWGRETRKLTPLVKRINIKCIVKPLKFDQIKNNEFAVRWDIYGQKNCNILILLNCQKLDNANIFVIIYFKYLILYKYYKKYYNIKMWIL